MAIGNVLSGNPPKAHVLSEVRSSVKRKANAKEEVDPPEGTIVKRSATAPSDARTPFKSGGNITELGIKMAIESFKPPKHNNSRHIINDKAIKMLLVK